MAYEVMGLLLHSPRPLLDAHSITSACNNPSSSHRFCSDNITLARLQVIAQCHTFSLIDKWPLNGHLFRLATYYDDYVVPLVVACLKKDSSKRPPTTRSNSSLCMPRSSHEVGPGLSLPSVTSSNIAPKGCQRGQRQATRSNCCEFHIV